MPIQSILKNAVLLIIPLVWVSLFLFQNTSKVEKLDSSELVELNCGLSIPVSGDAWDYIQPAYHVGHLWWNPIHIKQSRPMHIFTANYVGRALEFIGISKTIPSGVENPEKYKKVYVDVRRFQILSEFWPYFLAFILINVFLLFLVMKISFKIINSYAFSKSRTYSAILVLSVFVSFNYLMKSFFYNAHSQMFAVFAVFLLMYLTWKINTDYNLYKKQYYYWILSLGVLMLFYGTFIYVIPFILFVEVYVNKLSWKFIRENYIRWVVSFLIFVLPTIGYILYLKHVQNVTYFNLEVEVNRQFVWLFDLIMGKGNALTVLNEKAFAFAESFELINLVLLILLLIISYAVFILKKGDRYIKLVLFIAFYMLLFAFANGAYKPRFTLIFTFPVILSALLLLNKEKIETPQSKVIYSSQFLFLVFWVVYNWNF